MCRWPHEERVRANAAMQCHQQIPLVVLQGIQAHLDSQSLRVARLVCKEWAGELGGRVRNVQVPPSLWQYSSPEGPGQLSRLIATYWSFNTVHLRYEPDRPIEAGAVQQAVATLARVPSLQRVGVHGLAGDEAWDLVLTTLQQLTSSNQLTDLELLDVELPSAEGLGALAAFAPHLQTLTLTTQHSNQLQPAHVAAITSVYNLQQLRLSFRATSGSMLYGPLALDPLGQLPRLEHLEVTYTGLPELGGNMGFISPTPLSGCNSLRHLLLRNVPLLNCEGLAQGSKQLTTLLLQQLEALSAAHTRHLASFKQLQRLELQPLPLELLPAVAPLKQLQQLAVRLWAPDHLRQHMAADQQLASLTQLTRLEQLTLSGPIWVTQDNLQLLAAALGSLQQLHLHVALTDGTEGLQKFANLRRLQVRPYRTRRAAHDGSSSGSLMQDATCSVCVAPLTLPPQLEALEGEDMWFKAEHQDLTQQFLEEHVPLRQSFAHSSSLTRLTLRSNSLSQEEGLALPDLWMLPDLQQLTLQHPHLTAGHMDLVKAHCGKSLTSLELSALEPHLRQGRKDARAGSEHGSSSSSSSFADDGAPWTHGGGAAAAATAAPPAPMATTLERLPSLTEFLSAALGASPSMSGNSNGYSDIGVELGDSLRLLGDFECLERVTLEVGSKQLTSKVKHTISGLTALKELSLVVATDTPAATAKELGMWLSTLGHLRRLEVQLLGPGGCAAAQHALNQHLQRAVPGYCGPWH